MPIIGKPRKKAVLSRICPVDGAEVDCKASLGAMNGRSVLLPIVFLIGSAHEIENLFFSKILRR